MKILGNIYYYLIVTLLYLHCFTMENSNLQIKIRSSLFSKDPESSDLGRDIISKSIEMINLLGFESFTFKKLGAAIGSNESSVYRYFSNKHMLLVYLVNWYWSWMDYKIVLETSKLNKAEDKIKMSIELLVADIKQDSNFSFINEVLLNKIIITESSKAYHTKDVDNENEKGFYKTYKHAYNYDEVKDKAMNLGLDLKGGINVILQISWILLHRNLGPPCAYCQLYVRFSQRI